MLALSFNVYSNDWSYAFGATCRETITNRLRETKNDVPNKTIYLEVINRDSYEDLDTEYSNQVLKYFGYSNYKFVDKNKLLFTFDKIGDVNPPEVSAILRYLRQDDESFDYKIPFIDALNKRVNEMEFFVNRQMSHKVYDMNKNLLTLFSNIRLLADYNPTFFIILYTLNRDIVNPEIENSISNGISNALRNYFDLNKKEGSTLLRNFILERKKNFLLKFFDAITVEKNEIPYTTIADVLNTLINGYK